MTRFVIISDTHELHDQVILPEGDVLIHCGDWTNKGTVRAMTSFLEWFTKQPHTNKILIPGNHELTLDNANKNQSFDLIKKFQDKTPFYFLLNSGITLHGFNIYGSSYTPFFYNWAFNRQRGREIAKEWAKIPDDTDILITHGPPYKTLDLVEDNLSNMGRDLHQGCKDLADRVKQLPNLKLSCFGHLHYQGSQQITIDNTVFVNAAICTEKNQPTNQPMVIDL